MNLDTKPLRKTTAALVQLNVSQLQQALNELVTTVREEGEVDESWQLDVQNLRWVRQSAPEQTAPEPAPLKLEV